MVYALHHVATCTSSYFLGSSLPVIQVLVDENTTYMDIKLALLNHYESIDHIEDVDTTAYDAAVQELFEMLPYPLEVVPKQLYSVGVMGEDDEWDLYMYFILETLDGSEA